MRGEGEKGRRDAVSSFAEEFANVEKHVAEHRFGEAACESILLARMIRRKEPRQRRGEGEVRAVRKRIRREAFDLAARFQDAEIGAHRDATEHEDGAGRQNFQIAFEIGAAVVEFTRERLIVGRGAARGRRDEGAREREAVVAANGCGLARETGFVKRLIQEVAAAVAREHAASAIGAVGGGSKAEDDELRVGVAEAGYGLAPVVPFAEGAALHLGNFLSIDNQAWTFAAADDLGVEFGEFGGVRQLI